MTTEMSTSVSDNETNGLLMPSGSTSAISCRGRDDFARRLHDRLKSFTYNTENVDTVDGSWSIDSLDNSLYGTPPTYLEIKAITKQNGNLHEDDSSSGETFFDSETDATCEKISNLLLDCLENEMYETASDESIHLTNGELKYKNISILTENCNNNQEVQQNGFQKHEDNGITNGKETPPRLIIKECTPESEEEDVIPRIRRCSSLKSGKTPPGTPERKKIVRFADALGLDLADVKTFVDEIPQIPNSAYNDLRNFEINNVGSNTQQTTKLEKVLMPLFQQPCSNADFLDRVREDLVVLENAVVEDPVALCIRGTVRVRNVDFHKSVYIRYSLDRWNSFTEISATYVEDSCDGFSDKFTFLIYANTVPVGHRLEFAVRFHARGCQYWDSNKGTNYCFQCMPATNSAPVFNGTVPSIFDDHWGASFY